MIASIPPANVQAGNLNDVLALSGDAPPPAITPTVTGQRTAGTPRGKGARQATVAGPPVVPAQQQQKPFWNAPNIATVVGAGAGLFAGGPGGAVAGATGGRVIGKVIQAIRSGKATVDANGNIIDKAGNILGKAADVLGKAGGGLGGIFGSGGRSMNAGGGGSQYGGGFGGGGGYGGGGTYGGSGGSRIGEGIGGAYRNR
jgi:hypothetical protein